MGLGEDLEVPGVYWGGLHLALLSVLHPECLSWSSEGKGLNFFDLLGNLGILSCKNSTAGLFFDNLGNSTLSVKLGKIFCWEKQDLGTYLTAVIILSTSLSFPAQLR